MFIVNNYIVYSRLQRYNEISRKHGIILLNADTNLLTFIFFIFLIHFPFTPNLFIYKSIR